MSELTSDDPVPDAVTAVICRICEGFEGEWASGQGPGLRRVFDSHAEEVPQRFHPHLFAELLRVDMEMRQELGQSISEGRYADGFPEFQPVVSEVIRKCAETVAFVASAEPAQSAGGAGAVKDDTESRIRPAPSDLSTLQHIGKYEILGRLGEGGFGVVFRARHPDLQRDVAVKLAKPDHFRTAADREHFLDEARLAARLHGPGIVTVHDVDRDGPYTYIVQELIEGRDLKRALQEKDYALAERMRIIADIAGTIGRAHAQRVYHRDLKPSNILLDADDAVHVTDFGLALDASRGDLPRGEQCGTPEYMAPEQVRGESHRLDGRCDVWSLGVMLYEMLVQSPPFGRRSDSELFDRILHDEPVPPSQLNRDVPHELERICLRCLEKGMRDRYASAYELEDDLRQWLRDREAAGKSDRGTPEPSCVVVPRGLRAFDREDADFFLDLLPGPRDRLGQPDSIRFWRAQIEQRDADRTFAVGLIYGPSGSGKSSLVKAGLLPRLEPQVQCIYVEADADNTERRLLKELRKAVGQNLDEFALPEILAHLRAGRWLPRRKKLLIVLDQFEQWLHGTADYADSLLVAALRQCDGGRLQCLVLVRDDFWMAVTRFFRTLEVELVEGHNAAVVDRFDMRHAERVLRLFGQAYGALPTDPTQLAPEHRRFLSQSVHLLAQDERVISVRLAVFADMLKGKPWRPATLKAAGGAKGIGVRFLEDALDPVRGQPKYRPHAEAARHVLQRLLPEVGSELKGHMKSGSELRAATPYGNREGQFQELLQILETELRLITRTDPIDAPDDSGRMRREPYYQLTHDYLVPSLRQWLTARQRETHRGRWELRLAEQSSLWNAKPENRYLPLAWEFLNIVGFTSARSWTEPQRRMMVRSCRVHGFRFAIAMAVLLLIAVGIVAVRSRVVEARNGARADGLVRQLAVADIAAVPDLIAAMRSDWDRCVPRLCAVADDPHRSDAERLRATIALADCPGDRASRLIDYALAADLPTLQAIRDRLAPYAQRLTAELWEAALRDAPAPPSQLRAGALLAVADPIGDRWQQLAPAVVHALIAENTLDLEAWAELLRPASGSLTPLLRTRFFDASATPAERVMAARALARYADAELLGELMLEADASQFAMLFPAAARYPNAVAEAARRQLRAVEDERSGDPARVRRARRVRNAAVILFRLREPFDVGRILAACRDPTPRSMLILQMRDFGVPLEELLGAGDELRDPAARQALLLAIEPYRDREMTPETHQRVCDRLASVLRDGQHQAERSAAEWLLRRWQGRQAVKSRMQEIESALPVSAGSTDDRDWWTTGQGHTMTIVRGPVTFDMGSPDDEPGREAEETLISTTIAYSFAMSVHEVSIEQYQRFDPNADFAWDVADDPTCPANRLSMRDAMRYCRWLSERDGVPEDQMCYGPLSEIEVGDGTLPEERLLRTGYRLPTEGEWEYACRAGSTTRWFSGAAEEHLPQFAWYALSAGERLRPVGSLRPNPFGLFDMAGNVAEWCHASAVDQRYVLRGGAYDYPARRVRSAQRGRQMDTRFSFTGFRIACTISSDP